MRPGFPAQVIADARVAAKDHARVVQDDEDALFDRLVAAACALAEEFLRVSLIVREHQAVLPACGGWQRLPAAPVVAIGAVMGVPAEGAAFALPVGDYAIDLDSAGDGWVRIIRPGGDLEVGGRVTVSYSAGLATDWAGVPAPVAQGIVRLIGHLYAERDSGSAPPAAVTALWRPFRRIALMERVR